VIQGQLKLLEILLLTAMGPPLPKAPSQLSSSNRPYPGEAAFTLCSTSTRQKGELWRDHLDIMWN